MTNRTRKTDTTECRVCGRNVQSNNEHKICSSCQQYVIPAKKYYNKFDVSYDEIPRLIKRYKAHLTEVREDRRKNHGKGVRNRV